MKLIQLPSHTQIKFAIFGKIHYLNYFLERLHDEKFQVPIVFISPESQYERDQRLLSKHRLWDDLNILVERGLAIKKVTEDVNLPECMNEIIRNGCNVGFSINCRNIIKRSLIEHFEGRLFNIHDSFLPNERGGALNTWRILNNILLVGNTIHQVDEGIDSGDIAFQEKVELKDEFPLPIDYDRAQLQCCYKIFDQFIESCVKNKPIVLSPQNNDASIYLPRLYTEINGAIDWDWDAEDVERFIRAFSDPYPGAYTFIKERKVHILRASLAQPNHRFHPFCNGKVITVHHDGSVTTVAGGRCLRIRKVSFDEDVIDASRVLNIKNTLYTPRELLDKARYYVPKIQDMK